MAAPAPTIKAAGCTGANMFDRWLERMVFARRLEDQWHRCDGTLILTIPMN
jgi:hypothetical protein